MVLPKLSTWTCLQDSTHVAEYAAEITERLKLGCVLTMTIRRTKSGVYYAHTAIGGSSVAYETLDYYDQPPGI